MADQKDTVRALVDLFPYMMEGTTLLAQLIRGLSAEDLGDDPAAIQAAIDRYRASQADRDAAIDALEAAVAAKRGGA